MSREIPQYGFFVDWDNDGGFEAGLDGWDGYPDPPVPPEPTPASIRSVSSAESDSASFSVTKPSGASEGDILVACQTSNLGDASDLGTPTGGATWQQLGSTITGGTDSLHTKVWWKEAGGAEPASYGFTQGSGADGCVSIAAVQGADGAVTPAVAAFDPFADDTSIPTPGITPTNADDVELRWVGAQYTTPPPETLTKTYTATWSASWYDYGKRSGTRLYQGATLLGDGTGYQYGKIGFDHSTIQTDLAGSTIDQVELRMSNEHSWYNSGLTARFGTHANTSEPGGSSSTSGTFNRSSHSWNKGQTKYVDLPTTIGEELRDATTTGITTGRPTAGNRNDYGYFRGYDASSSQRPRLRITYTTAGSQPVTIDGPSGLTRRTDQSSNDFTAGALATRQLDGAETTASLAFDANAEFVRAHGVTIAVASLQPTPDPDLSPTVSVSAARARSGGQSLLAEWTDDSPGQSARRVLDGLLVGRAYDLSAWVYVPTGSTPVRLGINGFGAGTVSTTHDAWEQLTYSFTAHGASHTAVVRPDLDVILESTFEDDSEISNSGGDSATHWVPGGGGPPVLAHSTQGSFQGAGSLFVTWGTATSGEFPQIQRDVPGFEVGAEYEFSAWVFVPEGAGGPGVSPFAEGGFGTASVTTDTWERISRTFTASSTTVNVKIIAVDDVNDGETVFVDQVSIMRVDESAASGEEASVDVVQLLGPGEDITDRVLGLRTTVDISYGRDHARSLSAISPGQTGWELDNRSQDYSPDNPNSPLVGQVGPGRPVLIRATWQDKLYDLFRGHLDDYELDPSRESRSVQLTALDTLARLRGAKLSTELYASVRTGEAIGIILDAIGWPADRRDLDPGASTLRWWWGESDDAFDVLSKVVEAEGPAAFAFVSSSGDFVFRDRHHRLQRDASLTSQATIRDTGTEPVFSRPVDYDIGWKDIVNTLQVDVPERAPAREEVVWEDEGIITLAAGEVRTIRVQADDPFVYAHTPVAGSRVTSADAEHIYPVDHDLVVLSGELAVSLSRTSGQSTEIRLEAGTAGATIRGLRLRATPVPVARTVQVLIEDTESIAAYGRRDYEGDLDLAGVHDVADMARLILGQRSDRLPIMTITIVGKGHTARMDQILQRDLSDRVRLVESESFTDHDHYIERIEHDIAEVGHDHRAAFGCERVREQFTNALTFDDDDRGFDEGVFGRAGVDDPDTLFVLDQSNLDEGLLGH
ncbi:carbohydrate binding domain-containing protein [Nocardiopsis sp. YSL2]|uniref:carbohydrate binding domain-containing protein n=1 Tax=Nocardiopsis sp. YSL2 TaxID=2939492 RepID=UPI0026F463EB|nr:carbohydrate binding domain-containing protein [Nocardiopsis sp. YSL2]